MTSKQKTILRRTKAHYGEKTEKNLRKSGDTRHGDLKVKPANIVYVDIHKKLTQTQNTMKLEQNSIEMITALRNHPCSKHSAELNQPLRNHDIAFSEANLLLRFARRRVFERVLCVFAALHLRMMDVRCVHCSHGIFEIFL